MNRTGSIAIARAVLGGRGALMVATGLLVLIASALSHAALSHIAAALVFAFGMVALHLLGQYDAKSLGSPWANIIRLTDLLSLLVLAIATFGPLVIVTIGGHPHWDVPVLAGVLLIWWSTLDVLIADYRRIRVALLVIAAAWIPLTFLHATTVQIAHALAGMAAVSMGISVWVLKRAMVGVPRQYRIIEVDAEDDVTKAS